jgi:translation initiation factor 1A
MPANTKGGKGYRKGKNTTAENVKMLEWESDKGEMIGRTLKKLGDRRFNVFCNDNKNRICKLAGSIRKNQWVDEGALVLIGIRELGTSTTEKSTEIGDILALVDQRIYGALKKQEGMNKLLFTNLEADDAATIQRKVNAVKSGEDDHDDIFDRGSEEEEEDDAEQKAQKKIQEQEIAKKRDEKYLATDDQEVNLDDL